MTSGSIVNVDNKNWSEDLSYDCCEGCPITHCDYYAQYVVQLQQQEQEQQLGSSTPTSLQDAEKSDVVGEDHGKTIHTTPNTGAKTTGTCSAASTGLQLPPAIQARRAVSTELSVNVNRTNNVSPRNYYTVQNTPTTNNTNTANHTAGSPKQLKGAAQEEDSVPTEHFICEEDLLLLKQFTPQPYINSLAALSCALDKVFVFYPPKFSNSNYGTNSAENPPDENWPMRKHCIQTLLQHVHLSARDIAHYAHCNRHFPYTRNLVATDSQHYTLLLLCWNAQQESKIHNHPCDGCFVKSLAGEIKETKYIISEPTVSDSDRNVDGKDSSDEFVAKKPRLCAANADTDDQHSATTSGCRKMKVLSETILSRGQVTYMDDFVGYHKVGNNAPAKLTNQNTNDYNNDNENHVEEDNVAITLHVYTPPYQTCKVWASPDNADETFTGTVCCYSEYGQIVCTNANNNNENSANKECWHFYI